MKFIYLILNTLLTFSSGTPIIRRKRDDYEAFNFNKNHILSNIETGPRWKLDFNKFSSISSDDFNKFKGYRFRHDLVRNNNNTINKIIPTSWDWRDKGIVGPVKDQGQCGSCWAFSAVGALESQIMKKTKQSISLSEQNMVDCVKNVLSPDNTTECCDGCEGGEMYSVYQYLQNNQNKKDDTEKQYPYTAVDQNCNAVPSNVNAALKGYVSLQKGDEKAMAQALYTVGPLSVGVNANQDWQLYSSGIYDPSDDQCDPSIYAQDHGVILVGFGSEGGLDYWIVRNSWGEDWGENGYLRLARGHNACGVANSAIYPIVS